MNAQALAALFVLVVWWSSTGLVLRMVWLGRSTFRVVAFGLLAAAGFWGLIVTGKRDSIGAAYVAFSSALAVWAWHELVFLLGIVTGPRKTGLPLGARGWRRFRYATAAVIHHEVALAATLLAIAAVTWGQVNQVGTWTFLTLWIMRLSAKLNVFLGVRNLSEQFVPDHMRYMLSYFRRARMNWLMPVSVTAASAIVVYLAKSPEGAPEFSVVGRTLVETMLALAVLEHVFLAFPVPDAALWRWATRTKVGGEAERLRSMRAEAP